MILRSLSSTLFPYTTLFRSQARELIRRSLAEVRTAGGLIACGAGTDQLVPDPRVTLEDVERAYEEQVGYVEEQGRSEEHTSELQSRLHLVCRLLLEKKKKKK